MKRSKEWGWSALFVIVVLSFAAIGWRATPWDKMAWWGPLGCGAAYRETHVLPKGCEPAPPPCECRK